MHRSMPSSTYIGRHSSSGDSIQSKSNFILAWPQTCRHGAFTNGFYVVTELLHSQIENIVIDTHFTTKVARSKRI